MLFFNAVACRRQFSAISDLGRVASGFGVGSGLGFIEFNIGFPKAVRFLSQGFGHQERFQ